MAFRTTTDAVQAILGDNYGYTAGGTLPDLTSFVQMANVLINRVVTMAGQKTVFPVSLGSDEQEILERLMAAHFYCISDPLYTSRSTQGASGNFQTGTPDEGFGATEYGRQAMATDYSGCLKQLSLKRRAGIAWLGKPKSQQIPYSSRD